ncbi:MAG: hypothetical protein AAF245_07200, partial [Pseudomonadota bacterium]
MDRSKDREENREMAREYAAGARQYYESAKAADAVVGHWKGYEIVAPFSVMALTAHSIELSLKSYLLHSGEKDLRNKFGHSLVRAYAKVEEIESERGGTLPQIDDKLLAIIDDLHRNHTLRYSEPSKHG